MAMPARTEREQQMSAQKALNAMTSRARRFRATAGAILGLVISDSSGSAQSNDLIDFGDIHSDCVIRLDVDVHCESDDLNSGQRAGCEDVRSIAGGYCIRSSGDPCTSDSDCAVGGCGGELCYNPALSGGGTICDCGSPQGPCCGCVEGYCSWFTRHGDIARDGGIGLSDLTILLSHYGIPAGAIYDEGDLDLDGDVDLDDLSCLLSLFGTPCPS